MTQSRGAARPSQWLLHDAKARFCELVQRAKSEGPQHITIHGRESVVVISTEQFRELKGVTTGKALVDALQASPYRDINLTPKRGPKPVRDVDLWRSAARYQHDVEGRRFIRPTSKAS